MVKDFELKYYNQEDAWKNYDNNKKLFVLFLKT